jgi:hypothetical protein
LGREISEGKVTRRREKRLITNTKTKSILNPIIIDMKTIEKDEILKNSVSNYIVVRDED